MEIILFALAGLATCLPQV